MLHYWSIVILQFLRNLNHSKNEAIDTGMKILVPYKKFMNKKSLLDRKNAFITGNNSEEHRPCPAMVK